MTDILALTNPAAFGRATRVQRSVIEMMDRFEVKEQWPIEVAAMLSQIGFVILPAATQEKLYAGLELNDSEHDMLGRVPKIVEQLLANIPRLERVREILHLYSRHFSGDEMEGQPLPWGARALKIAIDYDILESQMKVNGEPFEVLRGRSGWYDPEILEGFAQLHGSSKQELVLRELTLADMAPGMLFGEDVKSAKGLLLIARGQEVTNSLLERIRNFSTELGIKEKIQMVERVKNVHQRKLETELEPTTSRIPA